LAHEGGKTLNPMHLLLLPTRDIPGAHGVARRIKLMKNPNDPIRHGTTTFQLVVHCLNQLCFHVPQNIKMCFLFSWGPNFQDIFMRNKFILTFVLPVVLYFPITAINCYFLRNATEAISVVLSGLMNVFQSYGYVNSDNRRGTWLDVV